jgi:hypothetical protein
MLRCANGSFAVKLGPPVTDAPEPPSEGATLGRMSLDKTFAGDLVASSRGEMVFARTPVADSAGYAAVERVHGALHGRTGSFALLHNGVMARGEQRLRILVVPDSGTGELAGLTGTMQIVVDGDQHTYELEYELPADRA